MSICVIALSGGIDSSVAAILLKRDWERLVGASHFIWPGSTCCSAQAFSRAEGICRRIKIPYLQVDLYEEFKKKVVENFVSTYLEGRTPNPCVVCNSEIRFSLFYKRLKKLLSVENLTFSTGHYARISKTAQGFFLQKARDPAKDQAYMLYRINKQMLKNLSFPLGNYLKSEVLSLADSCDLEYTSIRESQDVCFVDTNYADFISRYKGTNQSKLFCPGDIVDLEGSLLGRHRGTIYYTVGQRKGLGLGSGPWYVARLEPDTNRVVAARREQAMRIRFSVEDLNWFIDIIDIPDQTLRCKVKVRYQTDEIPCRFELHGQNVQVELKKPEIITPGQSAVFYDGDLILGGGIIV